MNLTGWHYLWFSKFRVHQCTLESYVVSFEMSFLGSSPGDSDAVDQGWGPRICILISTWYRWAEDHTLRNTGRGDLKGQSTLQLPWVIYLHWKCFSEFFSGMWAKHFFYDSHSCRQENLHEICSGFLLHFQNWKKKTFDV